MTKFVMMAGATLAMLTAASAADFPHKEPVYQQANVGKAPIGKAPIGKSPLGKAPVSAKY